MKKTKNVILITIDSLRADHLSCLGYHRKTTPNLDNLAKEGILFRNAMSCGADTPTSITPLMASTYVLMDLIRGGGFDKLGTKIEEKPDELSARIKEFEKIGAITFEIHRDKTTIAEVLKGCGYNTAAFHSNPFLSSYFNFGKEFDYFYDSFSSIEGFRKHAIQSKIEGILKKNMRLYHFVKSVYNKVLSNNPPYDRAEMINRRAISWLEDHKNNFFVWIHYMDVHFPYKPLKKFQLYSRSKSMSNLEMSNLNDKMIYKPEEMSEDEIKDLIDLYDGGIRYVDYAIQSLLNELSKMDILDNTLIIITADHGEEFRDHGGFAHGAKLYDELIRVPLIVYGSAYKHVEVDVPVSHIDISPTILDLLDVPEIESFQGKSLIPLIKEERKSSGVISETLGRGKRNISYRTTEWKYILNEADAQYELYNLRDDPKEKKNLYEKEKEKVREFELKIREHISKQERIKTGLKEEEGEIIKKRIRALKRVGKV